MNATSSEPAPSISWRESLLLFIAVLLLATPQAALLPLIDRDEPRFAEATREMIQSGNFIVPTFNGVPRYDKPPLIYWCQVVAYEIFGQNTFAARLPSLLATAATAVLIFTWGVRLGNGQAGLAAALCYAFCLQTLQQGRVATSDALLIFFMTLTAFTGWLIVRPKSSARAPLACHIVLALGFAGGFLAKGPEAWLPLVALLWCAGEKRDGIILSFIASLGLVLLWGVPAYMETGGKYLSHAWNTGIAERATVGLQDHGSTSLLGYVVTLPLYLVVFWLSALPWSPLILIRARRLFTGWRLDPADTYLLLNVVPLVVVFTLMATKLPHYTLPAFPMIALLFARRWNSVGLPPCLPIWLVGSFGLIFGLVTLVGIPLGLQHGLSPSPVGDLVRTAGDNLKPDTQFALIDFKEPTAIWEMRRICQPDGQLIDRTLLNDFLNQNGPRAAIISTELLSELKQRQGNLLTNKLCFETRGLNASKIKIAAPYFLPRAESIDLTLIVKP